MGKTVTISDQLAELIEARQAALGLPSIDAAVEALLAQELVADAADDHNAGYSIDELRALIDEADASGPPEPWDPAAVRAELRRRHETRRRT
jgi:hypothetical protein